MFKESATLVCSTLFLLIFSIIDIFTYNDIVQDTLSSLEDSIYFLDIILYTFVLSIFVEIFINNIENER